MSLANLFTNKNIKEAILKKMKILHLGEFTLENVSLTAFTFKNTILNLTLPAES